MQAVRPPAVAGTFYPAQARELAALVDRLVRDAADTQQSPSACPKALVVPHAGYVYSGPIAAAAFARVAPFAERIERVILIGPAHRVFVDGLASPGAARLATPLGEVEVDRGALADAHIAEHPAAHAREHALEVELPFLQRVLPRAKVVPLIGSRAQPFEIAALLHGWYGGPETLFVISSDLSHYEPYAAGRVHDERTAARVVELDTTLAGEDACGALAINGLCELARGKGLTVELVDLRSSGDTAGSRAEVVGYGAFAAYEAAA